MADNAKLDDVIQNAEQLFIENRYQEVYDFLLKYIYMLVAFLIVWGITGIEKLVLMADNAILDDVLQNAEQLFIEKRYQEVYDLLIQYSDQNLSEIKWREARALYSLTRWAIDKIERSKLIEDAYSLIKGAIELDEQNFEVHKWMAIILDAYADLGGIKSRVTKLETVIKHLKRAVELNPRDADSWHLLGSFEFEFAEVPWISGKIFSAIYATVPTGTYEKALEYFQRSNEEFKPKYFSLNWLMTAKCFIALHRKDDAKPFLDKIVNCYVLDEDDKNCKKEATQLLKKF